MRLQTLFKELEPHNFRLQNYVGFKNSPSFCLHIGLSHFQSTPPPKRKCDKFFIKKTSFILIICDLHNNIIDDTRINWDICKRK